jgi:hypothetical protein
MYQLMETGGGGGRSGQKWECYSETSKFVSSVYTSVQGVRLHKPATRLKYDVQRRPSYSPIRFSSLLPSPWKYLYLAANFKSRKRTKNLCSVPWYVMCMTKNMCSVPWYVMCMTKNMCSVPWYVMCMTKNLCYVPWYVMCVCLSLLIMTPRCNYGLRYCPKLTDNSQLSTA